VASGPSGFGPETARTSTASCRSEPGPPAKKTPLFLKALFLKDLPFKDLLLKDLLLKDPFAKDLLLRETPTIWSPTAKDLRPPPLIKRVF